MSSPIARSSKLTRYLKRRSAQGSIPLAQRSIPLSQRSIKGRRASDTVRLRAQVRIADVLGTEGEQDLLAQSRSVLAGEEIEEHEEAQLAAGGEGDVLGAEVPAVFMPQQPRQGLDEPALALRGAVVAEHACEALRCLRELRELGAEQRLERRDVGGVAAAQHERVAAACQCAPEVFHELCDPGRLGEPLSKTREMHALKPGV